MLRKNLIVLRGGRQSLHPTWFNPKQPRDWDLYLCPYQPLTAPGVAPAPDVKCGEVIEGPKWSGLRQLLRTWQGWREYDYIWLPDDDIFASQDALNRMFASAAALSFDLCAPALHEASYYAHYSTMRNHRCFARRVGFVEIMVPCFRTEVLARLLPTLDLSSTGWGWGLDSLWPRLLDYQGLGIIDGTPVLHTRPVGGFRDAELRQRVHAESDHIMASHDCRQVHTTYAMIGPDLRPLTLTSPALLGALVDGWRYLLEANPAVLPWIVAAQQPQGGWPAYPIAGTPTGAAFLDKGEDKP